MPTILSYPTFKVDPHKYRQGLAGTAANLGARLTLVDPGLPPEFGDVLSALPGIHYTRPSQAATSTDGLPAAWEARPADYAFIQHSAGTTGLQKAVAVTHGQVMAQLAGLATTLGIGTSDIMYSWLPLYHDMGLITALLLPLVTHMPVVTQAATDWVLDPLSMLYHMSERRCTLAFMPNFAFQLLADRLSAACGRGRPRARALDLSCVRGLINASEPVRAATMDALARAGQPYGLSATALHSLYGMAENVMAATTSNVGGRPAAVAALGRPQVTGAGTAGGGGSTGLHPAPSSSFLQDVSIRIPRCRLRGLTASCCPKGTWASW